MHKSVLVILLLGSLISYPAAADANRELHERIMVLDSHLDTPVKLINPDFDIMRRYNVIEDNSQVDFPRMQEGGLDLYLINI